MVQMLLGLHTCMRVWTPQGALPRTLKMTLYPDARLVFDKYDSLVVEAAAVLNREVCDASTRTLLQVCAERSCCICHGLFDLCNKHTNE